MKLLLRLLLLLPAMALADDPFSCVDPRFRAAFMPGAYGDSVYSTELPAGFISHPTPPGASLVGSQLVGGMATSVIYEIDGAQNAIEETVAALEQDGWKNLDRYEGRGRGFQSSGMGNFRRLCQDDGEGLLTLTTQQSSGRTFLSISLSSAGGNRSCADVGGRMHAYNTISLGKEVPNLDLPSGAASRGGGSGGGQDEWETHTLVETDMDRASLLSILNDQIRDQGWTFDTRWSGSRSAGSAWSKTSEDGELLIGTLQAYGDSDDRLNLRFTILVDREARSGVQIATF